MSKIEEIYRFKGGETMAKEMVITPKKCIGCTTCALTCSITYHDEFDLTKAHVTIKKHDLNGQFDITFSSTCRSCYKCAEVCPAGCLRVVEVPELPAAADK